MEEEKSKFRKPRIRKAPVSQREKVEIERTKSQSTSRKEKITSSAGTKIKSTSGFLAKDYYLPMPNNRFGRFMNKRRSFVPKYFKDSWVELKQVTWPGRKETWRLTFAVFVFAIIFGVLVAIVDKGLDALFRDLILE